MSSEFSNINSLADHSIGNDYMRSTNFGTDKAIIPAILKSSMNKMPLG